MEMEVKKQNFLMPFISADHWYSLSFGTNAPVDLLLVIVLSVKINDWRPHQCFCAYRKINESL